MAAERDFITVVTGLPRSGTSLMMRMLLEGGMPLVTDELRPADIDNPNGYFEFEPVKGLDKGDEAWLETARGKGVKVISSLLAYLPRRYRYRVIFMHRALEEVLASQAKMLAHRGEPAGTIGDAALVSLFDDHVRKVRAWLDAQPHVDVLDADFGQLVADPRPHAQQINTFLGDDLDVDRMVGAVDPSLHRNRSK